ncbi:MAG: hypothetical protein CVV04_00070 [Firmicutes bacterium HGW-Firmicutes-9]|jgi:hypothetical protein|nr:MAG: hypothetical protein CVV04_00070 [Firmicutes bacterium HGW-Firmicutes-9]
MESERATPISISGKTYELVLTTGATKQIAKRYGGLASLGDKLMKAENFENALDELIWLIALLANQSILIHNFQHPEDKRELLTEEAIELLTTPTDLSDYKDAIMDSMLRGTKRFVESEPQPEKNAPAG